MTATSGPAVFPCEADAAASYEVIGFEAPKRRPVPQNGYIVVKRKTVEKVTAGGIVLPEQMLQKTKPLEGTVVDGAGRFVVGTTVVFGLYAGMDVDVDGEVYVLIRHEDVVCTLEG